jgi:DNA-binding response OmpR family regulator
MARILVVEDTSVLHYVLTYTLEAAGFEVALADSLRAATRMLETETIDLILLDQNLPDGRGDDFLRYARHDRQQPLPIIIMSGTAQESVIRAMLELGANDYIIKPFSTDDLIYRIQQWLTTDVAS